ncbi:MAG: hypothetical protein R3304_10410 [Longimicrobiales bacterium]|nr:hypothetical protein [Longimicrobiales bacterium]
MKHSMTWTAALLTVSALTFHASPAAAQLSLEGRIGSVIPVGELSDEGGQTAGLGFAAEAMFSFSDRATAYAGVSRHDFNGEDGAADISSTGFNGGVKFLLGEGNAIPWVRGGLMIHKPDFGPGEGDWEAGLDTGVGVDWMVRPNIGIVPALRFNTYSSADVSLQFISLDLGLHLHLGR